MKTKQTWFVLLMAAGSLWLAPLAMAQQTNAAADAQVSAPAASATNEAMANHENESGGQPQPIIMFGQNVELKAGDEADVIVVIGGSAKVHGKVRQDVVTIGGGSEVDGEVGQNVVAIAGSIHLKPGAKIGQDTVAVMGAVTAIPR